MRHFFGQIWMILTLNCEQSARLTSESLDRELNWAERTAVKLHRLICSKSRKLDAQIEQMDSAFKHLLSDLQTSDVPDRLSPQAKQRIRNKLDDAQS